MAIALAVLGGQVHRDALSAADVDPPNQPIPSAYPAREEPVSLPGPLGHTDWPRDLVQRLEKQAKGGDGDAAFALNTYYAVNLHDMAKADFWLGRAALLHQPAAERILADALKQGRANHRPFGKTPVEARRRLLESACRTDGHACEERVEDLLHWPRDWAHDWEGTPIKEPSSSDPSLGDYREARRLLARCAQMGVRACWSGLARLLHEGIGGPRDDGAAYFWISLETRCVAPESIGGKQDWKTRELLAVTLTSTELEKCWADVDQFIADYRAGKRTISYPPFGGSSYSHGTAQVSARSADGREVEHRTRLRNRAPSSPSRKSCGKLGGGGDI
jgi:hypothetical protein